MTSAFLFFCCADFDRMIERFLWQFLVCFLALRRPQSGVFCVARSVELLFIHFIIVYSGRAVEVFKFSVVRISFRLFLVAKLARASVSTLLLFLQIVVAEPFSKLALCCCLC